MSVRSSQSITVEFTTTSPSTGGTVAADSLPTGTLVVNGTDNAATVTITSVATGRYKAAVTLPTLSIGDIVELAISATVATVSASAIIWRDTNDLALNSSGQPTAASVAGNVSGSVASVTGAVGSVTGAVGSVTSYGTLAADVAAAVWGATTRTLSVISDSSGITTLLSRLTSTRAGLLDFLDVAVSSRLAASAYTAGTAGITIADVQTALTNQGLTTTRSAYLDNLSTAAPTAAAIATAVKAGTVPTWYTLPDNTGIATIQTNQATINTNVLTRLATTSYTAPDNAGIGNAVTQATTAATQSTTAATQATAANTNAGLIKTVTDKLASLLEAGLGGLFRFTTAGLVNAPAGGGGGSGGGLTTDEAALLAATHGNTRRLLTGLVPDSGSQTYVDDVLTQNTAFDGDTYRKITPDNGSGFAAVYTPADEG